MRVLDLFYKYKKISVSGTGNSSSKIFVITDLLKKFPEIKKIVWVVNDKAEQENLIKNLTIWTKREIFPYVLNEYSERLNLIDRLYSVSRLKDSTAKIIVAPYVTLLANVPSERELEEQMINLEEKQHITNIELIDQLVSKGYEVAPGDFLEKGMYYQKGEIITIFPANSQYPLRVEIAFDEIEGLSYYSQSNGKETIKKTTQAEIFPIKIQADTGLLLDYLDKKTLFIEDEIDVLDDYFEAWNTMMEEAYKKSNSITITTFNEDVDSHVHLHYLPVLKYRGVYDFISDMREKQRLKWRVILFTKKIGEVKKILQENNILFAENKKELTDTKFILTVPVEKEDLFPEAFQNPELKTLLLTDKDISFLQEEGKRTFNQKVYLDFLTGLKPGDYVVHADHGIALFMGLEKKTIDEITREYLKLAYAENDKLFVPIDQADKISKYIGAEGQLPKLTRLGSAEWATITTRVRKETEEIAKELLILYAKRKSAKGYKFAPDNDFQEKFEKTFPYEETPGQIKSIIDVKADMEKDTPMDRLVCGDVGFGKTEVAMRAAFKAVQDKKQVALVSPITILADQHYRSFKKRMDDFHIRVEMLSRFKSPKEQKEILQKLERGEVDVVIGTHRLLQPDVKFKDLGLVVVDEEQRFGVKQKEKLKELKSEVDILTLTATPIPRTLNICLNKLRDISTITTPPYGRLPIITEVRRFSNGLVREAILKEVARHGQVYFLHNRVETIEGMAEKLRQLVPEATFGVAHGKLGSGDLEETVIAFKDHKFDVLVSSTIIENGIDLSNANTLIVNNAERFGLAQLYQLRGRVGRGKQQAYAYFLYHGQRLKLDAKKRLRAIVEASDLGSGFQIAMKDLEIRGAGDILGANQHGVINVVGVSHFIRMLNRAVEDLKAGRVAEGKEEAIIPEVAIELPVTAFIPDSYIVNAKDKINTYQKLSSADNLEYLNDLYEEMVQEYGQMPREVHNLFRVLELKIEAKKSGLTNIKAENIHMEKGKQIVLTMSKLVRPENIVKLLDFNKKWIISGTKLKINIEDLGLHWFDELKENVKKLQERI
ncbi:transcription-repair coupling factor [Candidatus Peregrinibacteria bacterium]|nr:transcription-repair coupling factor [Candidatus Peregrinibacteria bacterium]